MIFTLRTLQDLNDQTLIPDFLASLGGKGDVLRLLLFFPFSGGI
jgi:hypothetical protein